MHSIICRSKTRANGNWEALIDNGREKTEMNVSDWVVDAKKLGVGEILLTSVDKEGTQSEYDIELIELVCSKVNIPVIACGGAGSLKIITSLLTKVKASICYIIIISL